MARQISLQSAVSEIREACEGEPGEAFFFMVGAGVSTPQVPMASEIVKHCAELARSRGVPDDTSTDSKMDEYSHWFQQAYPHSIRRQKYLRELIEGRPSSPANLRLAHILLNGTIARLAITSNFDDFVSRALLLFGKAHVVCDHPATAERIDAERSDIQVVHVHGTYWFYDCVNLQGEIDERAHLADRPRTMGSLLDRVLARRSPIVIGYSGWPEDVFMSALKRRLDGSRLGYNAYWFVYRDAEIANLPDFLTEHEDVCLVTPGRAAVAGTRVETPRGTSGVVEASSSAETPVAQAAKGKDTGEPTQGAVRVLDAMIQEFAMDPPALTLDPVAFFVGEMRARLPADMPEAEDIYKIAKVIERLETLGKSTAPPPGDTLEARLEDLRNALRISQYKSAISLAADIPVDGLTPDQLSEVGDAAWTSAVGLLDNSPDEANAYAIALRAWDALAKSQPSQAPDLAPKIGQGLLYLGITLGNLGRGDEEIKAYDDLLGRFGQSTEPAARELVAIALVNKGVTLGNMGRSDEEIQGYEEVLNRFGDSAELSLREQVAKALFNKGVRLGNLGRGEEAVQAYDDALGRLREPAELSLREQVARVTFNKGVTLGNLGRTEEEIQAYDEVVRRFGEAPEPSLREQVAMALVNKGVTLGNFGRGEEAIQTYDEVIRRFGDAVEPALREQFAKAMGNKGNRLGDLGRGEEAVEAYDEVVRRLGDAPEPALREQVARTLFNKGVWLGNLGRVQEEIQAYEEVVARFGEAPEPALREQVAMALVNKGARLGSLGRSEEEIVVIDEVLARFGQAEEPALRKQVAMALANKGLTLGTLGRPEEELHAYDDVLGRFGDSPDPALREQVARTLFNKGVTLGNLGREEAALQAYDDVLGRFGDSPDPAILQQVAMALLNKGVRLGNIGRPDEEIQTYDEIMTKFGDAPDPALREQVAMAMVNKGLRLGTLGRGEEELQAYDEVVRRFEEAAEPGLRQQVANALVNKGMSLRSLGRGDEELQAYDEVLRRYGEAPEPGLSQPVIIARACRAGLLLAQGNKEEGLAELRTAIQGATSPALQVECAFYSYAHEDGGVARAEALKSLKTLLVAGARSSGWDMSANVTKAASDGHPEPQLLAALAAVTSGQSEISALDGFDAWKQAG